MKLCVDRHEFQLHTPFRISRGTQHVVDNLTVTLSDGSVQGRGETVGVDYRGETLDGIAAQIAAIAPEIEAGLTRDDLLQRLPPGGARNALDCALWDLEAKQKGVPVWQLAGLSPPHPVAATVTLSLDTPDNMAKAARAARVCNALKLKLGEGQQDVARVAAVRSAAPNAVLLCDVNGGWSFPQLQSYLPMLQELGMRMIEQPLPAGEDDRLQGYVSPIMLCADESCFDRRDLPLVAERYAAINIKLEKTGGLTEALALAAAARARGMQVMVGCMVSTSLSIAPALLVGAEGEWCDVDGPTYLREDREPSIRFDDGFAYPAQRELWG